MLIHHYHAREITQLKEQQLMETLFNLHIISLNVSGFYQLTSAVSSTFKLICVVVVESADKLCQLQQSPPTTACTVSCILFLKTAERPLHGKYQTPSSHITGNVTILQEVRWNSLS